MMCLPPNASLIATAWEFPITHNVMRRRAGRPLARGLRTQGLRRAIAALAAAAAAELPIRLEEFYFEC